MALHIYYRHAPSRVLGQKLRPSWFSYRRCFDNLVGTVASALADGRVTLSFVFDGSEEDFRSDETCGAVARLIQGRGAVAGAVDIRFISGGDQRKAWKQALALVLDDVGRGRAAVHDYVYFLENDYVHVADWLSKFDELAASSIRWDYLTLYDHLDKYPDLTTAADATRYRNLKSKIFCTGTHHWRTTPSTCATYVLPVKILLRDRLLLELGIADFKLFSILGRARRRTLLSPIPSLATHSMTEFLAPAVNWEGCVK
jgi:hypothetical protein